MDLLYFSIVISGGMVYKENDHKVVELSNKIFYS